MNKWCWWTNSWIYMRKDKWCLISDLNGNQLRVALWYWQIFNSIPLQYEGVSCLFLGIQLFPADFQSKPKIPMILAVGFITKVVFCIILAHVILKGWKTLSFNIYRTKKSNDNDGQNACESHQGKKNSYIVMHLLIYVYSIKFYSNMMKQ